MKHVHFFIALMVLCFLELSGFSYAAGVYNEEIADFNSSVGIQLALEKFDVLGGPANPNNMVARLPKNALSVEVKPDISVETKVMSFGLKPRFLANVEEVNIEGANESSERTEHAKVFINEGRLGLSFHDDMEFWIGRQVLLWGPAMSLNPSDPFFADSGKTNPYRELGGKDFVGVNWFGSNGWTFSYIDNVGKGRSTLDPFDDYTRIHTIKLDKIGDETYWSLNYSSKEGMADFVGSFFQVTLSDAFLFYADVGYDLERSQLQPKEYEDGLWSFDKNDQRKISGIGVGGIAYTMVSGQTLNFEFLYNNQGWGERETDDFEELLALSEEYVTNGGENAYNGMMNFSRASDVRSDLLGRNYAFFQFSHPNLGENIDFMLRLTKSLDDQSIRWVSNIEWNLGSSTQLFVLAVYNYGGFSDEMTMYIKNQVFTGLNFIF